MSKYRGRFGHFQGQPEIFSNNFLAQSWRAQSYRGQNVGNQCLWHVLENLRIRAVSRPFFCIFDRFIPKNRQLRAPTHSVRSIQLGIERDISSTGFRHPNENWGHYAVVPTHEGVGDCPSEWVFTALTALGGPQGPPACRHRLPRLAPDSCACRTFVQASASGVAMATEWCQPAS